MGTIIKSIATKQTQVADALSSEIQSGRYRIGDKLPSEAELSVRFGVSRHTIRAALRSLHTLGMIVSQQGIGSTVQQTRLVSQYSHGFSSAQDLLQYAKTTRVKTIDRTEVEVAESSAALFNCKVGEHWWRVRTVRAEPSGREVVAYSEVFIPLAFGSVLNEANSSREPIFSLISTRFGETIYDIEQEITCIASLDVEAATHLKVAPGSPGMQIVRRYLSRDGRVLEVARVLHPSEVFRYSMHVQLKHGA